MAFLVRGQALLSGAGSAVVQSNQLVSIAVYNDEDPETGREEYNRAHSKGVLRVKEAGAVWLQHRCALHMSEHRTTTGLTPWFEH